MSAPRRKRILIVGAGISGLTAAAALGRRGWDVDLIERKPEVSDAGGIGMTLVANAMRALDAIGVAEACVSVGMPADSLAICGPDGTLAVENPLPRIGGPQWPGATGIGRAAFHAILLQAARPVAAIRCGITVAGWRADDEGLDVDFSDGTSGRYELMVAADGIYSQIRTAVMPTIRPEVLPQAVWRAGIQRPPSVRRTHLFMGGRHGAVGICPVSEDDAYVYIVQASPIGTWRDPATLHQQMRDELQFYGGLVAEAAEQLDRPEAVNFRPLEWLLAPEPWGAGRVILIGDAAHANPPVLAQGAAMGIEDAIVLAEELSGSAGPIETALSRFVRRRLPRAAEVVQASCQLARRETEQAEDVDMPAVMRRTSELLAQPF